MGFFSASACLPGALCANSPAVIANLVGGGASLIVILLLITPRIFRDIFQISEELFRFIRFLLSLEGVTLVSAMVMGLSLYRQSHLFAQEVLCLI